MRDLRSRRCFWAVDSGGASEGQLLERWSGWHNSGPSEAERDGYVGARITLTAVQRVYACVRAARELD